jgi:hypothetical protein
MAEVIGIDVKIKRENFKQVYSKNSGQEITTEGIQEGWNALKKEKDLEHMIESLRNSPYYLRADNEQNK